MGKKLTTPEDQGDHQIWKAYGDQVMELTDTVDTTPGSALEKRRILEQVSALATPSAVAALHRIADALELIADRMPVPPGG
jgi:hypothetical protein